MLLSRSDQQDRGEPVVDLAQNRAGHSIPGFTADQIFVTRGNDGQAPACSRER
jgi:hypothetical protein